MKTSFENRCRILSEFWLANKTDFQCSEFISANDLGLPLSFLIHSKIIESNSEVEDYVNETWELFLDFAGKRDRGFKKLEEILLNQL